MRYYDIANSKTVSERQVLRDNPNTSFSRPLSDSALTDLNLARFTSDTRPDHNEDTQVVVKGSIEVRDGVAYQTYTVVDMSDEKKAVVAQRKIDAITAEIASRRYDAEVSGIEFNGKPIYTDRESRGTMKDGMDMLALMPENMQVIPDFKYADGSFGAVTLAELRSMLTSVFQHVTACYTKEAELKKAVEDGTYTEAMLQEKFPIELSDLGIDT